MNVLIVHRYFWPENLSVLPLMLKDVVELHLERGDQVTVVTGASEDFSATHREAFGEAPTIISFPAKIDRKLSMFGRGRNMIRLIGHAIKAIATGGRRDVIYLISYPPLMSGLLSAVARVFRRADAIVYYVQDNLIYRTPTRLGRRVFGWLHGLSMRMATVIITLSEDMKAELARLLPTGGGDKITVIPNYSPDMDAAFEAAERFDHDVIYAGTHGPAQNLFLFLDMLAQPALEPKPRVSFFGDGAVKEKLITHAKALGLDIAFNAPVGRDEINRQIARARFGLVGARADLMKYAYPSKLAAYNAMGARGLVMCPAEGACAAHIAAEDIGRAIDPTSAERGAHALAAALAQPVDREDRRTVRRAAERLYGRAAYRAAMTRLIDDLPTNPEGRPSAVLEKPGTV